MRCADPAEPADPVRLAWQTSSALLLWALLTAVMAGCSHAPEPGLVAPAPVSTAQPVPAPGSDHSMSAPARTTTAATTTTAPVALPPPRRVRHWDDYRLQAAQRMVAASPGATYSGPVPEPLLAIPVLTIDLNSDGSVRRVQVLRRPTQAHDTVQLAIAAVHRAAPYGPVGHLPKPWTFNEVFLFDETRRFKPRTLDD